MDYNNVLNQIFILFLLIFTGFIARRIRILNDNITKGITDLILKITLPSMIISSMIKDFTLELLLKSGQIVIISIVIYVFMIILSLFIPIIIKSKSHEKGVFKFSLVFSNVAFMGFPVVNAVFGEQGVFYTSIYNLPFNILVFTLGIMFLIKKDNENNTFNIKMFFNPGIISVIIGFVLFIFSIKLPYSIHQTINTLGNTTTPLSMIVIGSLLCKVRISFIFSNIRVYIITFFRLIIVPLFVFFVLRNFVSDYLILGIPVLISAMPVAANSAILAEEYGGNSELASQMVFISTLFSIISIPFIVKLLII